MKAILKQHHERITTLLLPQLFIRLICLNALLLIVSPVTMAETDQDQIDSLALKLQEIKTLEFAFYEQFNALNSKDEFDVHCADSLIKSREKRYSCEPAFLERQREEYRQEFLKSTAEARSLFARLRFRVLNPKEIPEIKLRERTAGYFEQLEVEIRAVVSNHLELRSDLDQLEKLKQDFNVLALQFPKTDLMTRLLAYGEGSSANEWTSAELIASEEPVTRVPHLREARD